MLNKNKTIRVRAFLIVLIFLFTALVPSYSFAATSTWVYMGADGKLAYKQDAQGNRIMDFSSAGYMGGGVRIPTVATTITVNPSGADDSAAIQNAIDTVEAMPLVNGFRGAVQLGAGTFNVSQPLTINASGVVVRGSGSGSGGTVIKMTGAADYLLFSVIGSGSRALSNTVNITGSYVPSGTNTITVSSTSGFSVGDTVVVTRTVTQEWIHYLGMDTLVRDGQPQTWLAPGTQIYTDRIIKSISGNTITLDAPLTDSFDAVYLGSPVGTLSKYSYSGRISQVGLEKFKVQAPAVATAYRSISMDKIIDAWVRDVRIQDGVNNFSLGSDSKRITVDNVHINHSVPSTSAALPADFTCTGTQIFFNKCSANGKGSNLFVTQGRGTGPIVVLNFTGTQSNGIAPHQRWTTGVLADSCNLPGTPGIVYRNRSTMGSGHGWTTGWSVAWNVTTDSFLVSQAPGTKNWSIGGIGTKTSRAPGDPDGIYESHGTPVTPSSLYLQQLLDRLGPQALENIGYGTPTHLALGKPVTYSSQQTGNEASHAVDGDTASRWAAQVFPQWMQVDLGATYNVNKTELVPYMDRAYQFKVEVSTDGTNYTQVVDRTANTTGGASIADTFTGTNARYVKLTVTGCYNDSTTWVSINEFRVFGDTATPTPTPTPTSTPTPTPTPTATPTSGPVWNSTMSYSAGTHNLGSTNTGIRTTEFDLTPLANGIDGLVGYADTSVAVTAATNFAMITRTNVNGTFEVRNGAAYAALAAVPYSANNTYHFKMVTDLNAKTYSVWVTPPGGSAIQIANNYAFRSDAPATDDLGQVCVRTAGADSLMTVANHIVY